MSTYKKVKKGISGLLVFVMVLALIPANSVKAEELGDYTEVTLEMCNDLSDDIDALEENFSYNQDTKDKLVLYRTTYNNYLRWDEMYGKDTALTSVRNADVLSDMEEAYGMIVLLESSYPVIQPFENLASYFDVSEEDFYAFQEVSGDAESDLTKFVGYFTGAADSVLAYFDKEGTAVKTDTTNLELANTVQAVYLFVQNNEKVFRGASVVKKLMVAAPETRDVTKATYDDVKPLVEEVGNVAAEFEESATGSQVNALNTRISGITGGKYNTIQELFSDYEAQCMKIGFEKKIDDLYEEIYSTMDYTTLSEDDTAISGLESEYDLLPRKVQERIANMNMLKALRDKYNENLSYYQSVIVPAEEVSQILESSFWELYDMKWPGCADAEENDSKTVEKNIIAADKIISNAKKAYEELTSAQKQHVTTVSYLNYMETTYSAMNIRYMTKVAGDLYKVLESDELLEYAAEINRAYQWLTGYIGQEERETLEDTLINEEDAESGVVNVINKAVSGLTYLQENIGKETEAAIRKLVTMEGSQKGAITAVEIKKVYEMYRKAMTYETAWEQLTENSKYEIEALYGLAVLAEKADTAIAEANEIDLTQKENADLFMEKHRLAAVAVNDFEIEFAQIKKDFSTLEDGSAACLSEDTFSGLISCRSDFELQAKWNKMISVYEELGEIEILDSETIASIKETWEMYTEITGDEGDENRIFVVKEIERYKQMADHVESFAFMMDAIPEVPQTDEEMQTVKEAENYYFNIFSDEERKLTPKVYYDKLLAVLGINERIKQVIQAIDQICAPVDDASYLEFVAALDHAGILYDAFIQEYSEGKEWIVNAGRLQACQTAREHIEGIKELLQLHSSRMCENLENIKAAIAAYEILPADTQNMVYNYVSLYQLYSDVSQASAVTNTLNGLIVLTLLDEPAVTAARVSYDSLSANAKQYVNNYIILTMAEKQIAALKQNQKNESDLKKNASAGGTDSGSKTSTDTVKKSIQKAKISKVSKKCKLSGKKKLNQKLKTIRKKVIVKLNGKKLVKNKDYSVKTKINKKKTKVTLCITGKNSYKGTKKVSIQIVYSKKV